jgi:hypothetical protein
MNEHNHPDKWEQGENRKADLMILSSKQKNTEKIEIVNEWEDHIVDQSQKGQNA